MLCKWLQPVAAEWVSDVGGVILARIFQDGFSETRQKRQLCHCANRCCVPASCQVVKSKASERSNCWQGDVHKRQAIAVSSFEVCKYDSFASFTVAIASALDRCRQVFYWFLNHYARQQTYQLSWQSVVPTALLDRAPKSEAWCSRLVCHAKRQMPCRGAIPHQC